MLTACKKDQKEQAFITLANGTVGSLPLRLLVNNQPVVTALAPMSTRSHMAITAGTATLSVVADQGSQLVYQTSVNLVPGKRYTVLVADLVQQAKGVVLEDDLSAPPATAAKVRFLHLAPGRWPVDILFGTTKVIANRAPLDVLTNQALAQYGLITLSGTMATDSVFYYRPGAGSPYSRGNSWGLTPGKIYTILGMPSSNPANDSTIVQRIIEMN